MSLIILVLSSSMSESFGQIQLKKKINTKMNDFQLLMSDENELLIEKKLNQSNRISINGEDIGILEKGENLVHLKGKSLNTLRKEGDCHFGNGTYYLSKKSINGNRITNFKESKFSCVGKTFHFFKDGNFVIRESYEGIFKGYHFYNSNHELINSYLFESEVGQSLHNFYNNTLLIVSTSENKTDLKGIDLLNQNGQKIFSKKLNIKGEVSKILSSENFVALSIFNDWPTVKHSLIVFDYQGNKIAEKQNNHSIKEWGFTEESIPKLVIGYKSKLELFDFITNKIIVEYSYLELYAKNGINPSRTDKYIEIQDIVEFPNKRIGVLLGEPMNGNSIHNNIICVFSEEPESKLEFISLGKSSRTPDVTIYNSQILIVKDNQIFKYE